jgi:hypothetical protein
VQWMVADRGRQLNHTVGYLDLSGPNTKSLRRPAFEAQEKEGGCTLARVRAGERALGASAVDRSFVHSFTAPNAFATVPLRHQPPFRMCACYSLLLEMKTWNSIAFLPALLLLILSNSTWTHTLSLSLAAGSAGPHAASVLASRCSRSCDTIAVSSSTWVDNLPTSALN